MRYISTRGEAPALNFVEVTLAGLARDGGLYVPESWPQLDAATIAGFAGRPYAEIAEPVVRRHAIVALHGPRQPDAPIQPATARPISSGESS